ncbi:hypothetical protein ASPSYDRAFT_47154 [Aspergillus sydowii CBS 593.65]|uniref:Uncharacterized protein n=1 Tax=Aspergillus sydowii CBS 593.65 TaxID=1036612 RepID=A0A1L9TBS2_9EURO|nr:uncharacterized protein ASPSYDRAFT_47154 [Aspergillus sydowii CBS 593.65]OJJ56877.1 hypothetical protein ASPSYDRAFT_47154 [Aspergillus sydowii CBS 593.65]
MHRLQYLQLFFTRTTAEHGHVSHDQVPRRRSPRTPSEAIRRGLPSLPPLQRQ